MKTKSSPGAILAKFCVPGHCVNIKQHGSAGVGHISAMDSIWFPPRQTLLGRHLKAFNIASSVHLQLPPISTKEVRQEIYEDPNKPGVYGAEHGTARSHGLLDGLYVVQQPAKLHGAEVGAEREARFMLQQHKIPIRCTPK